MANKTTHFCTFALTAAFCALPAVSILARAQDAPKQEPRAEESEKKTTEERKADKSKHDKKATREEDVKKEGRERDRTAASESERRTAQENRERDTHNRGTEAGAQRPQNVHYHFRSEDRSKLRQHFQAQLAHVDRANRPQITRETVIDVTYRTYIEPVPQDVVVLLAPPPPGYVFGFIGGYIIIYDPGTFFVVDFIDLF